MRLFTIIMIIALIIISPSLVLPLNPANNKGGSVKEVMDVFNTNVLGTCNVARAVTPYLRAAAEVPGQMAALATFGSLGSWSSSAAVAHCELTLLLSWPRAETVC